jgi:hypothetical protein
VVPSGPFIPHLNDPNLPRPQYVQSFENHPDRFKHDPKYLPKAKHQNLPEMAPFYKQTPLPLLKRGRTKNAIMVWPLVAFCFAIGTYSFNVVRRDDVTKDPHYEDVMSEIKREEIMAATKHLEKKNFGTKQ